MFNGPQGSGGQTNVVDLSLLFSVAKIHRMYVKYRAFTQAIHRSYVLGAGDHLLVFNEVQFIYGNAHTGFLSPSIAPTVVFDGMVRITSTSSPRKVTSPIFWNYTQCWAY